MDEKAYKQYKRMIARAEVAIDNKPPKFNVSYYYNKRNLTDDANRVRQIDKENIKMLQRMSIITRTRGVVDCWQPRINFQSNLEHPEAVNNMIKKSNQILLKRIREASSKYPTAELIKSWKSLKKKAIIDGRNTPFHRIVTGYWCQGGDVTRYNGSGGVSIFDQPFENENFNLRHAGPGILSMCNDDTNKNDSKFNLTFRMLETMDEKYVVFGKVISGLTNIYKIEEFGTQTGKPIKTIIVSNCGIISRKYEWYPQKSSDDVEIS
ncbi:uncharacterized protein LOC143143859 [Ptiloglossa arizonensis]|uniref:uncharacterized protein LOC143143859 n=1 Tax=Ptiloglossa arizonensis TaxID=3350558 RepID=UPI003F9FD750